MKLSPAEKLRPTPWDAIVVIVVVACAIALIPPLLLCSIATGGVSAILVRRVPNTT